MSKYHRMWWNVVLGRDKMGSFLGIGKIGKILKHSSRRWFLANEMTGDDKIWFFWESVRHCDQAWRAWFSWGNSREAALGRSLTCPDHTSSQRCRPLVESRSWSRSSCRRSSRREPAMCSLDSSSCLPRGPRPLRNYLIIGSSNTLIWGSYLIWSWSLY